MKMLYFDLGMGAAGDMLTSALLELLPDKDGFLKKLNSAGIPGVRFVAEKSSKCGIAGTHVTVLVNGEQEGEAHHHHHDVDHDHDHEHTGGEHHHHHGSVGEITHLVYDHLDVPDKIRKQITDVYGIIAEAESRVHGVPVTDVHFHEVGTMDALADVTAVCMLINEIAPDRIVASPVHVGSGQVRCAHGIMPVPAPATAEILKGIPSYGGAVRGELCTPTGAALLRYFVQSFGDMPVMKAERIGYGMGKKDFEAANCVRAILGDAENGAGRVTELSFNVDDMTAEEIGFATEMFFESGAKEVFTLAAGMKKNRPGTLVCILCGEGDKYGMIETVFRYTTTIGIREKSVERHVLDRRTETLDTGYGTVRRKISRGYGAEKNKLEYDDISRIAKENGVSLREARELVEREI